MKLFMAQVNDSVDNLRLLTTGGSDSSPRFPSVIICHKRNTLKDDQVNAQTHTYPHKPLRKFK